MNTEHAETPAAPYRDVRALQRGLEVLTELNRSPQGSCSITELAERTGIHRTTVRRLLETLARGGYVRVSPSSGHYCLTIRVRELSEGFTDREWITSIATPAMGELLQTVKWPSDLTTLDGTHMLIRESTHRFSPLSFDRNMVGKRMPILLTASGRAYLAACSVQERKEILRMVRAEDSIQSSIAASPRLVAQMIEQVLARGYAVNEGDWNRSSPKGILALPIMHRNKVLACLNLIYIRRGLTHQQAAERYLPALKHAVVTIERQLAAWAGSDPL